MKSKSSKPPEPHKQKSSLPKQSSDPDSRLHQKFDRVIVLLEVIARLLEDQRQRAIRKDRERRT